MSKDTLLFLNWLLGQVTLSAQAEDFEVQAARIATARRELREALEAEDDDPPPVIQRIDRPGVAQ